MVGSANNYTLSVFEKAMPEFLTVREKLLYAKTCGFDAMELSIDESIERQKRLKWSKEEIQKLNQFSGEHDIFIRTICLSAHRRFPMGSHDQGIRERSMEIMRETIDFADRIGVRAIQLAGYDVYYETGDEQTRLYFEENLKCAVESAARHGVTLAFETMETEFMDTVEKALKYVNSINSPYLQIYPDIGNLTNAAYKYQCQAADDIAKGAGHIIAAHLKETMPGKYRNMEFGTGQTDYIPCIRQLWREGVRRYTAEFWYSGEDNWQKRLKDAAHFLRDKIETATEDIA